MSDTMSAGEVLTLSPSRKRSTPEGGHDTVVTPRKVPKTDSQDDQDRNASVNAASPAISVLSEARASLAPSLDASPSKATLKQDTKQPVKKRTKSEIEAARAQKEAEKIQREAERQAKLAEKEEKRKQKELEDCLKEEERQKKQAEKEQERLKKQAEKEEERLKKQAERDSRQAERDAKQQQRDEEKAAKEAEKQRKIDELEKKERSQLRMNNFFTARPTKSSSTRMTASQNTIADSAATDGHASKVATNDYATTFLPFSVPKNGQLAPINFFVKHIEKEDTTIPSDQVLANENEQPATLTFEPKSSRPASHSIGELLSIVQGTSKYPIDLTSQEFARGMQDAIATLNQNLTYLEFHEDVRPPFCGSFMKKVSAAELQRVKRNPTKQKVQVLNYDYDSEAEWEEPEEGEDIIVDEDDEESEDGDDDMAEFIDDEGNNDPLATRRPAYIRDLPPVSSGLQWQIHNGQLVPAHMESANVSWQDLEMCFLLVPNPTAINPFSGQYWEAKSQMTAPKGATGSNLASSSDRPALLDKTRKINGVNALAPKVFKVTKTIPSEEMAAFKAAIQGQELTKIAMREHLKKLFPKLNKEAINNTLDEVAERDGKKATAKWRLK